MANPARKYDDPQDPRLVTDPMNPTPPLGPDPLNPEPLTTGIPDRDERLMRSGRGMGTSVLIAAVVLVLAIIAYFAFGPRSTETVMPQQPAATEPTAPAPSDATPAKPAEPAPAQQAPATPAQPAPAQ